ncbi:MAG: ribosome-associated translation inhibitor RaiA [Candidatus Limnocylindrales bacterium]
MRTIVKGKNIDVPDSVRQYAERKMRRLERFLDDRTEAVVELSTEQHRSGTDSQIVEVMLVVDGQPLRSHAAGPTYQASLDTVIDRIERQAVDFREKPKGKARAYAGKSKRIVEEGGAVPSGKAAATATETPEEKARRSRIVKTKRFAIEPMFEEDAVARMEELGHVFFIFVNAETERLCVLYKRDGGDYGLIEPVIAGEYTPGRNGHKAG